MDQYLAGRFKQFVLGSPLYHIYIWYRHHCPMGRLVAAWERAGRPAPPPHPIKQQIVRDYACVYHLPVLIETGTYLGDMVYAMQQTFDRIVSIEIQPLLAQQARRQFRRSPHIEILTGDSAALLPAVLATLSQPALFWLDGHYSAGVTGKGALETPILQEVSLIFAHPVREHVILIDDANGFEEGWPDYPTLDALCRFVAERRPELTFSVADNIIRIHA